jgi:hypothetical protein
MSTPTDRRTFLQLAAVGAAVGLAPAVVPAIPSEPVKPELADDRPPVSQADRDAGRLAATSPANLQIREMIKRLKFDRDMIDRWVEQDHGSGCSCPFCSYEPSNRRSGSYRDDAQFVYDSLWVASWDLSTTIGVLENHSFHTDAERQQLIAEMKAGRS